MQKMISSLPFQSAKDMIEFDDAKDPSSSIYENEELRVESTHSSIPESTKKMIINLYCVKKRCEEEKILLQEEVKRLDLYLQKECSILSDCITSLDYEESSYTNMGLICVLKTKHCTLSQELTKLKNVFKDIPEYVNYEVSVPITTDNISFLGNETFDEDLMQASEVFLDYTSDEDFNF
jgi:hypothetical protein